MQKYRYLSLNLFKVFKLFFFALLFISVVNLINPIPFFWPIFLGIIILHVLYILAHIGTISISTKGGHDYLHIKDLYNNITFESKLTLDHWWSYDFQRSVDMKEKSIGSSKAGNNYIDVFLKVSDANNEPILFVETIIFDMRFPKESPHAIKKTDDFNKIRVQRVDKILAFLSARST